MDRNITQKIRVLFFAWGYSIHAKRRIQLFIDDPKFKVAVVSNHNYNFDNAVNVLLTGATGHFPSQEKDEIAYHRVGGRAENLYKKTHKALAGLLPLKVCHDIYVGLKDYKILNKSVKEFKPDIVFLQTLLYPCYLAYFLPRSLPIVITFWNGDVIWWAKWNGIERMLKKQIVTYGVRRAQAMTVNSQTAFNACLGYGAQTENIHLIRYPGVDMERFRPFAKDKARKKLGITFENVVLWPRGLGGYLNSDIIIESAASVIKRYPDTLFLFLSGVGDEAKWEEHLKRARELGIERNLRREGQVQWEMMPLYYSSSDVMVSISSEDSLPNCMLEAMACGVPVIMGDIPQIREWVTDGVNGFLAPPRDPVVLSNRILKVFEDSEGVIGSFIRKNMERVDLDVDSRKSVKKVKDLVCLISEMNKNKIA